MRAETKRLPRNQLHIRKNLFSHKGPILLLPHVKFQLVSKLSRVEIRLSRRLTKTFHLLDDGFMGNLVILVENVETEKRRLRSPHEQ